MDITSQVSNDTTSSQQNPCASVEITMQEATVETVAPSSPLSIHGKQSEQPGLETNQHSVDLTDDVT